MMVLAKQAVQGYRLERLLWQQLGRKVHQRQARGSHRYSGES
jgi:hypothetical protein